MYVYIYVCESYLYDLRVTILLNKHGHAFVVAAIGDPNYKNVALLIHDSLVYCWNAQY